MPTWIAVLLGCWLCLVIGFVGGAWWAGTLSGQRVADAEAEAAAAWQHALETQAKNRELSARNVMTYLDARAARRTVRNG